MQECVSNIQEKYGDNAVSVQIPHFVNKEFKGIVDIIHKTYVTLDGKKGDIPADLTDEVNSTYDSLLESVIEIDDAIVEKYLGGEEVSQDEFLSCLKKSIIAGTFHPILFSAALQNQGAKLILDFICTYMPSPADKGNVEVSKEDGSTEELSFDKNGPLGALVFKTMTDPYVGRISLVKVFSGDLTSSSKLYNTAQEKTDKIGQIATFVGKNEVSIDRIPAGDIGAITKLGLTKTGDTLTNPDHPFTIPWIQLPIPNARMSIKAGKKSDEDKLGSVLPKIQEDDISIIIERDSDTYETIIRGMGNTHLQVANGKGKKKIWCYISVGRTKNCL